MKENQEIIKSNEEISLDNLQEIPDIVIDTASVVGLNDKEQEEHYANQLKGLSQEAIINQAEQILNYSDNYMQSGIMPVATLFENCSMVIGKYVSGDKADEFKQSLKNSLDCIKDKTRYKERITALRDKDESSFIVTPVTAIGHLFSSVIYKNGENYDIYIINKGASYDPTTNKNYEFCEKYIVPEKNLENIVQVFSKLVENIKENKKKVDEVYRFIEENTVDKKHNPQEMYDARNQRVGNCYFKELEEGLKFAYSKAFNKFEIYTYNTGNNQVIQRQTPKVPGGTKQFHNELIDNLKKYCNNEDTIKKLGTLLDIYNQNKDFRSKVNDKTNLNDVEKEKIFFEVFGDGKRDIADTTVFRSCLGKVDERTLRDNLDFFIKMLKDRNIKLPMLMYECMNKQMDVDFVYSSEKYLEARKKTEDLEFLDKYFPTVSYKIRIRASEKEINMIRYSIIGEYKRGNCDVAEKMVEKCMLMNPSITNRAFLYMDLGDIRKRQGRIIEALYLYKKGYEDVRGCDERRAKIILDRYNNAIKRAQELKKRLDELNVETKSNSEFKLVKEKAAILKQFGEGKQALEEYTKAIEMMSQNKEKNLAEIIITLKEQALLMREIGESEENVKATYDKALELINTQMENNNILEMKADILREKGEEREAEKIYRRILKEMDSQKSKKKNEDYSRIVGKYNGIQLKIDTEKEIADLRISKKEQLMNMRSEIQDGIFKSQKRYTKETLNELKKVAKQYTKVGREEKALEYYMEVLRHGRDKESFYNSINLLRVLNRSNDALKIIDYEIKNPQNYSTGGYAVTDKEYLKLRVERYNCLIDLGRKEDALDECKYIIEDLNMGDVENNRIKREMLIGRAKLLQKLGYKRQALNEYREIYKTYKNTAGVPRKILRNIYELNKEIEENPELSNIKYKYKKDTLPLYENVGDTPKKLSVFEKVEQIKKISGIDFTNDVRKNEKIYNNIGLNDYLEKIDDKKFKILLGIIEKGADKYKSPTDKLNYRFYIIGNIMESLKPQKTKAVQEDKKAKKAEKTEKSNNNEIDKRIRKIYSVSRVNLGTNESAKENIAKMTDEQFNTFIAMVENYAKENGGDKAKMLEYVKYQIKRVQNNKELPKEPNKSKVEEPELQEALSIDEKLEILNNECKIAINYSETTKTKIELLNAKQFRELRKEIREYMSKGENIGYDEIKEYVEKSIRLIRQRQLEDNANKHIPNNKQTVAGISIYDKVKKINEICGIQLEKMKVSMEVFERLEKMGEGEYNELVSDIKKHLDIYKDAINGDMSKEKIAKFVVGKINTFAVNEISKIGKDEPNKTVKNPSKPKQKLEQRKAELESNIKKHIKLLIEKKKENTKQKIETTELVENVQARRNSQRTNKNDKDGKKPNVGRDELV